MIQRLVTPGSLVMLFSLKINIFSKPTWIVLLHLPKLCYLGFPKKQLLHGLIQILCIIEGKELPLQMPTVLILRQMVPPLLVSCVAPPEFLNLLSGMHLPMLP